MIALSRLWKTYLLCTILLVAGMAVTGFIVEAKARESLIKHTRNHVLTLTRVIAKSVPQGEAPSVVSEFCRSFAKASGARITLIGRDGTVIGESHAEVGRPETKLDRPEVQEALQKGEGSSIRFSRTLRIDMLYAALFLEEKERVIRLAVPLSMVKGLENDLMVVFSVGLFLTPVLAILMMFFFVKVAIKEEKGRVRSA